MGYLRNDLKAHLLFYYSLPLLCRGGPLFTFRQYICLYFVHTLSFLSMVCHFTISFHHSSSPWEHFISAISHLARPRQNTSLGAVLTVLLKYSAFQVLRWGFLIYILHFPAFCMTHFLGLGVSTAVNITCISAIGFSRKHILASTLLLFCIFCHFHKPAANTMPAVPAAFPGMAATARSLLHLIFITKTYALCFTCIFLLNALRLFRGVLYICWCHIGSAFHN